MCSRTVFNGRRGGALCLVLLGFLCSGIIDRVDAARRTARQDAPLRVPGAQAHFRRMDELYRQGDLHGAAKAGVAAYEAAAKEAGPDHDYTARIANAAGTVCADAEQTDDAYRLFRAAIRIFEHTAPKSRVLGAALTNLATCCQRRGRLRQAERYQSEALDALLTAMGRDSNDVVQSLVLLGGILMERGRYQKAEQALRRAVKVLPRLDPPAPGLQGRVEEQLGLLYTRVGEPERGMEHAGRALDAYKTATPPNPAAVAGALITQALLRRNMGLYDEALANSDEALRVLAEAGQGDSSHAVGALHVRATARCSLGDFDGAVKDQALAIGWIEEHRGPNSPHLVHYRNNLGWFNTRRGNYVEARRHLEQARLLAERIYGAQSTSVADTTCSLALVAALTGDTTTALTELEKGNAAYEKVLESLAHFGSEFQKLALMKTIAGKTDFAVELHLRRAPESGRACRLALTTVLRRKGRTLDVMAGTLSRLRTSTDEGQRKRLTSLSEARAELASLLVRGARTVAAKERVVELEEKARRLEADLGAATEDVARGQSVTVSGLAERLPPKSILIEYVFFRPFDPRTPDCQEDSIPRRCAAYALEPDGTTHAVCLATEDVIRAAASRFLDQLRRSAPEHVLSASAKDLYDLVVAPLSKAIDSADRILVCPDGILCLIPFAALMTPQDRYLVQDHELAHLTTGRDLFRIGRQRPRVRGFYVFADPAFGDAGSPRSEAAPQQRAFSLDGTRFEPLPGTAEEARRIGQLAPSAVVCTGKRATEARVKALRRPSLLHLATHGFFLGEGSARQGSRGLKKLPGPTATDTYAASLRPMAGRFENPLVRSGLALSGANHLRSGEEDGVLTALEVAGLDLSGTKLVVLSACETGVGEYTHGTGVFGLRRAFVLAGAETQVLSLWPVQDAATCELMVRYYSALKKGAGRAEALQQVQTGMLAEQEHQHPSIWAAFMVQGDWRPLNSRAASRENEDE